jgi:hypothetical protein
MTLFGVDLSSNQSITAAINSNIDFAYMRVRRSNGAVDTSWGTFHGLITKPRAPYCFVRPPTDESFASQVSSFLSMCGWSTGTVWEWGPVWDCEYSGMTGAQIAQLLAEARRQMGVQTQVVYIGYADRSLVPAFATDVNVRIIMARYYANNGAEAFTNLGWSSPNLDGVQYWYAATVTGVNGSVDVNNLLRLSGGNQGENMTDPFSTYSAPAPILDANGNYTGQDAPTPTDFADDERFTNASVRWLIEHWAPSVNQALATMQTALTTQQEAQVGKIAPGPYYLTDTPPAS